MSKFTLVGRLEEESVGNIQDYLTPMELSSLNNLQVDFENLQNIDSEFTNAIQAINSARQTIDSEIDAFNVLDGFLYDDNGLSRIDFWLTAINNVLDVTELNPVNSVMAFGTKAVLETVKFIKTNDPGFQLSSYETRIGELESEREVLQAEKNTLTMETEFSNVVVNLANTVHRKHDQLQTSINRYQTDIVKRSPHVERFTSIINSLNIHPPLSTLESSEIEKTGRENLLSFWTECLKMQDLGNPLC
jgi:hypothetical protein